jgi:uncharacterized protein (DUF58 family)
VAQESSVAGLAPRLKPEGRIARRLLAPIRALRRYVEGWLSQYRGTEPGSIVLVQRRIFILPSRHGIVFVCALLLMLTGSINYSLSLGFVLTFLLAALGINSILHTFRNLAQLRISPGRVTAVYAGDHARFTLILDSSGTLDRYSIGITRTGIGIVYADVAAGHATTVSVAVPAPRRGMLLPGRLTLFTYYPLGLCYAWSYIEPDVRCLVYPRPEANNAPLPLIEAQGGQGISHGSGQEDFSGLRSAHPGDSPRHIAWKAAAREQGLLTKQFSGRVDTELWLDWQATPDTLGVEGRLSRLTRWVIDAHAAGLSFGLRLPGVTLPPAPGNAQHDRCLEALALFDGAIRDDLRQR